MSVKVMLFGSLVDAVGTNQIDVKLQNVVDVDSLKSKLLCDFPKLSKCNFVIAVYKHVVNGNTKLNNGDTVALLPPFAGG